MSSPFWEAEVKYQEFSVLLWQPKRRDVASGFTVGMGSHLAGLGMDAC